MEENCYIVHCSKKIEFSINRNSKILDKDDKLNKRFLECYGRGLDEIETHDLSDGTRTFIPILDHNGVTEFVIIHSDKKAEPMPIKIADGNYRIKMSNKEMVIKVKDGKSEIGRIEKPIYEFSCIILEENPDMLVGYRLFL